MRAEILEMLNKKRLGKKMRAENEPSNGGVVADEAEFQQFLAILDRLQAGLNHFQKKGVGDCVGKSVATPTTHHGVINSRKTSVPQNNTVFPFDLNSEPAADLSD